MVSISACVLYIMLKWTCGERGALTWWPSEQAAELGMMLFEQNQELESKLAESVEEVERLKALVVETSQELAAVRKSRPQLGRQVEDLQREALRWVSLRLVSELLTCVPVARRLLGDGVTASKPLTTRPKPRLLRAVPGLRQRSPSSIPNGTS